MPEQTPPQGSQNASQARDTLLMRVKEVLMQSEKSDPEAIIKTLKKELLEIQRVSEGLQIIFGGMSPQLKNMIGHTEAFRDLIKGFSTDLVNAKGLLSALSNIQAQIVGLEKVHKINREESLRFMIAQIDALSKNQQILKSMSSESEKFLKLLKQWHDVQGLNIFDAAKSELENTQEMLQSWASQFQIKLPSFIIESDSLDSLKASLDTWIKNLNVPLEISPGIDLEKLKESLQLQLEIAQKEQNKIYSILHGWAPDKLQGISTRLQKTFENTVIDNFIEAAKGKVRKEASIFERGIAGISSYVQAQHERSELEKKGLSPVRLPQIGEKSASVIFEAASMYLKQTLDKAKPKSTDALQSTEGMLASSRSATLAERIVSAYKQGKLTSFEDILYQPSIAQVIKNPKSLEREPIGEKQLRILQDQSDQLKILTKINTQSLEVETNSLEEQKGLADKVEFVGTQDLLTNAGTRPTPPPIQDSIVRAAIGIVPGIVQGTYYLGASAISKAGEYLDNGAVKIMQDMGNTISKTATIFIGEATGRVTGTMFDSIIKAITIGVERTKQEALVSREFAVAGGRGAAPSGSIIASLQGQGLGWMLREDIQAYATRFAQSTGIKQEQALGISSDGITILAQYMNLSKQFGDVAVDAFEKIYAGLGNAKMSLQTVHYTVTKLHTELKDTMVTGQSLLRTISNLSEITRLYNVDVRLVGTSLEMLAKKSGVLGGFGINIQSSEVQTQIMRDFYDKSRLSLPMLAYLNTQGGQEGLSPTYGIVKGLFGSKIAEGLQLNLSPDSKSAILSLPNSLIGNMREGMFKGLETITATQELLMKRATLLKAMEGKSKDEAIVSAILAGEKLFGMSKEGVIALLAYSEEQIKQQENLTKLQQTTLPTQQQISTNTARIAGLAEANQQIQTAMLNAIVGIAGLVAVTPVLIVTGLTKALSKAPGFSNIFTKEDEIKYQASMDAAKRGGIMLSESFLKTGEVLKTVGEKGASGMGGMDMIKLVMTAYTGRKQHSGGLNIDLSKGVVTELSEYILPSLGSNEAFILGKGTADVLTQSQVSERTKSILKDLTLPSPSMPKPEVNVTTQPQITINIDVASMDKEVIFNAIKEKLSKELA